MEFILVATSRTMFFSVQDNPRLMTFVTSIQTLGEFVRSFFLAFKHSCSNIRLWRIKILNLGRKCYC